MLCLHNFAWGFDKLTFKFIKNIVEIIFFQKKKDFYFFFYFKNSRTIHYIDKNFPL